MIVEIVCKKCGNVTKVQVMGVECDVVLDAKYVNRLTNGLLKRMYNCSNKEVVCSSVNATM